MDAFENADAEILHVTLRMRVANFMPKNIHIHVHRHCWLPAVTLARILLDTSKTANSLGVPDIQSYWDSTQGRIYVLNFRYVCENRSISSHRGVFNPKLESYMVSEGLMAVCSENMIGCEEYQRLTSNHRSGIRWWM
jgi:hypothetical protein